MSHGIWVNTMSGMTGQAVVHIECTGFVAFSLLIDSIDEDALLVSMLILVLVWCLHGMIFLCATSICLRYWKLETGLFQDSLKTKTCFCAL